MNARLFEKVAGIIRSAGFMSLAFAAAARIGIRIVAVAVLLVNSDRNVTLKHAIAMIASVGKSRMPWTRSPIRTDSPDDLNADAMASPPPKRIRIPHEILLAVG